MSEYGTSEQLKARAKAPQSGRVAKPLSVSARLGRLQFHESGKFRVLVFSDVQDGPKLNADTVRLVSASLDVARPDVVIFTGNQIAGYDEAYASTFRKRTWSPQGWAFNSDAARRREESTAKLRETVRSYIAQLVEPLVERGVPWAVTYGDHDFQCGLSNAEQDAIYREFPGCLNPEPSATPGGMGSAGVQHFDQSRHQPGSGLPDQPIFPCEPGTFALPVTSVDHKRDVLSLVVLNSGDYGKLGGYGAPSTRALEFLGAVPGMVHSKSMVFQHIPMPQYYRLLKEVPATAAHAVEGYRTFAGHTYVIDDKKTVPGSFLGEGISCPDADSGEFDILTRAAFGYDHRDREELKFEDDVDERGYFAMLAGHDHRNRFVGQSDGLTMFATPTCGFGSYGPAPTQRASRLLEFDIRHPYQPRTQLLEFGELVGKPNAHGAYTYDLNGARNTVREGTNLLRRPRLIARALHKLHLK